MKVYDAKDIRNVAVIGHGAVGKTSLCSTLLFAAGAVNRLGKVNDGTTVTDFDPDEIERKISISTALAHLEWKKVKVNLIDTPGYGVFVADAKAGLRVADAALCLVCGVAGVEVQTERTWSWADELGVPRLVMINKLDRERASFDRALESIGNRFGRAAVPVMLPIGVEKDFRGVIDLLSMKAHVYQKDESGKFQTADVPADMANDAKAARAKLVEMIAEQDDALMEKFFEQGDLANEEVIAGLRRAVVERKLFPVLCGASLLNVGTTQVLDALVEYAPPATRLATVEGTTKDGADASRPATNEGDLSAFVFKTVADPFAGRITLFRVYSGILKADNTYWNANREMAERFGPVFLLQGKTQVTVPEIHAGDLGAVAKLKETTTGETLTAKESPITYKAVEFPRPAISFAVEPKSKQDDEKITTALRKLAEEDPTIHIGRDPRTNEFLVSGTGQLHVEVTLAKMKKRFGVEAILHPPKVPYLETIRGKAEVQGRHKKQTGGRGQFGDCWIRMEPLPRGSDFQFTSEVFGGAIPRNFIPAIEKGIQEQRQKGVLAGYPVVDFKAVVYDGSYHTVDSSEMAFKLAAIKAFKAAVLECKPCLLEPIMTVEITVPDEFTGDIMGDLSSRRGRVQGTDGRGGQSVVKAQVPMAEMLTYASTLKSMTQDRGSFDMQFDHYSEVPSHIAEKIIADAKAARGEEVEEES
ncbi:MAG: elongation factor G [Acidobacteriota bacterium]